jgi:alpha-glucan phosphorylase-like protein
MSISYSEKITESGPLWRDLFIQPGLPESLKGLQKLSRNLWMSWNFEAIELFEYINKQLWERCHFNPVLFLRSLSYERTEELQSDKHFIARLGSVEQTFDAYMAVPMQYAHPDIAYFSMEYGLTNYLRLYSGGLGILAGDYLKEASDMGVHISAVGLLYKNGYFKQHFTSSGEQIAGNDDQDFSTLPLDLVKDNEGNTLTITMPFPGRNVGAQVWKLCIGRINLYLLDTYIADNSADDKFITSKLYGGNSETRLQQELFLGIGGIQALKAMNIHPNVYHCNEGHAAFIGIERIASLRDRYNLSYDEALEIVRSSNLFTTHTAVPAANDVFSKDMLKAYLPHKIKYFDDDWEKFMALGQTGEYENDEHFSMPYLAAHISKEINGVSKIHKFVSQDLFNVLWRDFKPAELHIGSITNGVHYSTWTAKEWQHVHKQILGEDYLRLLANKDAWQKIHTVPDSTIWEIRKTLKKKLVAAIKAKLSDNLPSNESPKKVMDIISNFDENSLIIGFARRFVTYKRSDLLFYDIDRLLKIVSNSDKPVQFLFAGKAHPNDQASIDMIKRVIQLSAMPEYKNRIIYLEEYDMELASLLVQGVDVWLNTPNRLMEASGTSGMKASMNGVLNFSVLDGWWAEGYKKDLGWAVKEDITYQRHDFQDQLDAETIYNIIESKIVPLYYNLNEEGIPEKWIKRIKNCIAGITPEFSMTRMLDEYRDIYYKKLGDRVLKLRENNFEGVKAITAWKKHVTQEWAGVLPVHVEVLNRENDQTQLGKPFTVRATINTGKINVNDIGVEVIFLNKNPLRPSEELYLNKEFTLTGSNTDGMAMYECELSFNNSGNYEYSYRIFAKHPLLSHRQDLPLIKWI